MLTASTACLYGKERSSKKHKHIPELIVGFKTGRSLLFPQVPPSDTKTKKHLIQTRGFVLAKPLNNYFRIETGVNYNTVQTSSTGIGYKNPITPYSVTVPVTIQYYFLPEKRRLKPFFGAGFQYQYNLSGANNPSSFPDIRNYTTPIQPGTKYVNILFTQGVTFEINTKIQISESIHFVPGSSDRMIGIDLGLGYKLP